MKLIRNIPNFYEECQIDIGDLIRQHHHNNNFISTVFGVVYPYTEFLEMPNPFHKIYGISTSMAFPDRAHDSPNAALIKRYFLDKYIWKTIE